MADLPTGYIFIPKMKNMVTITLEQKELICCKKCRHYFPDDNGHVVVYRCELGHEDMRSDFWCADAERGDEVG